MYATIVPITQLPEQYAPVAQAAHQLPAGTYGVVIATSTTPRLVSAPVGLTTVGASELAEELRALRGCQTYIVRRGIDCVTVHAGDMTHAGNLLGTAGAPIADRLTATATSTHEAYWVTLINRVMHDHDAQVDHDANIVAAMRRVHQLDAETPARGVWAVALREPRDAVAYVTAFIDLLTEGDTSAPDGQRHLAGRLYATHR